MHYDIELNSAAHYPVKGIVDLSPLIVIVLAQLALILPVAWLEQSLARLFQ